MSEQFSNDESESQSDQPQENPGAADQMRDDTGRANYAQPANQSIDETKVRSSPLSKLGPWIFASIVASVLIVTCGVVYLAGQAFLWFEWSYFVFITVALWNSATNHLRRAQEAGSGRAAWGHAGRALAVASGVLALGSFANLSGLTTLIFGEPMFIGLGTG